MVPPRGTLLSGQIAKLRVNPGKAGFRRWESDWGQIAMQMAAETCAAIWSFQRRNVSVGMQHNLVSEDDVDNAMVCSHTLKRMAAKPT